METMDAPNLEKILSTLFPSSQEEKTLPSPFTIEPAPQPITDEELSLAIEKMNRKNTAPGPNDVPRRVLGTILLELREKLTTFLNRCLRTGSFPKD